HAGYAHEPAHPTRAGTGDGGVPAGHEIELTRTNPTLADTDGDGIDDFHEDADADGLTNGEEVTGSKNTKFNNEPTDPMDADSDNDGVDDGTEIANGTNPNVANGGGATDR